MRTSTGWERPRAVTVAAAAWLLIASSMLAWADGWEETQAKLADRGITPALVYGGAAFANLDGGLRRGSTYLGNLDLQLTLDGQRLADWPGATVYLDALSIHGGRPSQFVGDAQGVSSIEAPAAFKLEEAWLQQNLFANQFSVLAGRYDLNSEFYRLHSAGLFLNSSFGVGPEFSQSGREGPSIFPFTSLGARFALKPERGIVLRAAVLDGVPFERPDGTHAAFQRGDGLLFVSEAAFLERPAPEDRPLSRRFRIGRSAMLPPYDAKLALGGWYYTATFDDLSGVDANGRPVQHRGSGGFYLLADGVLFRDLGRPGRRLAAFTELGFGDPRVNRFGSYAGAGLVASGLVSSRQSDELGLAVAIARNGAHFIALQEQQGAPVRNSEATIELTYSMQFAKWLAVQPDLQYVIDPNTDPSLRNALAFQLRFEATF
ncbi:MAG TPA: carbohydrate porin [Acidiferrobacterales bacterium]|nr:carbohydrate porin [Acidiferrobacterales bacterium]